MVFQKIFTKILFSESFMIWKQCWLSVLKIFFIQHAQILLKTLSMLIFRCRKKYGIYTIVYVFLKKEHHVLMVIFLIDLFLIYCDYFTIISLIFAINAVKFMMNQWNIFLRFFRCFSRIFSVRDKNREMEDSKRNILSSSFNISYQYLCFFQMLLVQILNHICCEPCVQMLLTLYYLPWRARICQILLVQKYFSLSLND